jgi:hypothetical protein
MVRHPGEVGRSRENVLREFLESFCPRGFEFGTGFVFDAHGRMSRQQDIIIYRNSYHPIFNIGGIHHYPVESVVAVIEVKSNLDSRASINDALNCIASVKGLDRTGKGRNYIVAGGVQAVLDANLHEHQIFSAVTMMSGSKSSTTVDVVADWCRSHQRTVWPNAVVSAFEYSVFYDTPGDLPRCNTMLATGLFASSSHPDNTIPILDFLGQLVSFLRVTPLIDFKPDNYFPCSLQCDYRQTL